MADAEVTEAQLAESNEPEFEQALADKKEAAAHADTAPAEFRQQEAQVITQGKAEAAAETTGGVAGMQSAKGAALAKLVADKGKTKTKDEAKRAEVTTKIQTIFDATEADGEERSSTGSIPRSIRSSTTARPRRGRSSRTTSRPRCRRTRRTGTAAGSAGSAGPGTS